MAAVQIGKALGARVLATAGGVDKLAVAKRAGDQRFLITAYPTDAIKEGTQIRRK